MKNVMAEWKKRKIIKSTVCKNGPKIQVRDCRKFQHFDIQEISVLVTSDDIRRHYGIGCIYVKKFKKCFSNIFYVILIANRKIIKNKAQKKALELIRRDIPMSKYNEST